MKVLGACQATSSKPPSQRPRPSAVARRSAHSSPSRPGRVTTTRSRSDLSSASPRAREPFRNSARTRSSACAHSLAAATRASCRALARRLGLVRPGPVEWEVLARSAGPVPLEPECVDFVLLGFGPGRHLAGANLRAGSVVQLYARALGDRGPGQRLGAPLDLARDLHAPGGEVVGDLEVDRGELEPADVRLGERGEDRGPAARLPGEDRLERLALALVRALVEEESRRRVLRLAGPDVPLERAHHDDVEPVERHVAVVPLADVPGQDAVALALVRRLGKRA